MVGGACSPLGAKSSYLKSGSSTRCNTMSGGTARTTAGREKTKRANDKSNLETFGLADKFYIFRCLCSKKRWDLAHFFPPKKKQEHLTVWASQTAGRSLIWYANSSQPCPWSYLLGCSRSSASQNEWPSLLACTPLPPAAEVPPSSSSEPPPPSHHPPTREDSTGLLKNKFQDA